MRSTDFIPYRRLAGDLLISQRRTYYRVTLTTKELVFQKPHMTYYLLLDDLLGLYPSNMRLEGKKTTSHRLYQLKVNELQVITRSGLHSQAPATLMLPIHPRFLRFFRVITGFTEIR